MGKVICYQNFNENKTEIIDLLNNKNNEDINNSKSINCDNLFYCCELKNIIYSYIFDEEDVKKEKEKFSKLKNELLERQKKLRSKKKENSYHSEININININNEEKEENEKKEKNETINQLLEDMCVYGDITKEQIKQEKENNPEKFIEINDALNLEKEDQELFALGLLADNLQKNGTDVVIEKDYNNEEEENEDDKDAGTTCLEFITNGMNNKKKYDLHFDFGKQKNEEYLNNEEKFEELKEQLKSKLSKDYNTPKEKIIITFPQRGSLRVQVIFQSDEFNNLDLEDFKSKFKNDNDFSELQNLKEIHMDTILGGCRLKKSQLDSQGNRVDGWGINEQRGKRPYYPPLGWIGIGLKVIDKYDDGDNKWLGMDNSDEEWCVAYHGIGQSQNSNQVKK